MGWHCVFSNCRTTKTRADDSKDSRYSNLELKDRASKQYQDDVLQNEKNQSKMRSYQTTFRLQTLEKKAVSRSINTAKKGASQAWNGNPKQRQGLYSCRSCGGRTGF
eukprot:scaffold10399_cov113-Cylindrotheca_fusiformis.AAC.2